MRKSLVKSSYRGQDSRINIKTRGTNALPVFPENIIVITAEEKQRIDTDNLLEYVDAMDLRAYGLIPEIVGRLPVITYLEPLDRDSLRRILVEPKNALVRQYEKLFEMDGMKLTIEPAVLDLIVDTSIKNKLGARGLRSIFEKVMTDAMFEAPALGKKTFTLTTGYAREKLTPSSSFKDNRRNKN